LAAAIAEVSALQPASGASGVIPLDAAIASFIAIDLDVMFAGLDTTLTSQQLSHFGLVVLGVLFSKASLAYLYVRPGSVGA